MSAPTQPIFSAAAAIVAVLTLVGCQGDLSKKQPFHLNPNMDQQARFDMQEGSSFFEDGRAMRPQVEGTVPRGELNADDAFYRGQQEGTTNWVTTIPERAWTDHEMLTDKSLKGLLVRGQERYDIYCAVCHDKAGDGQGPAVAREGGFMAPPSLHGSWVRGFHPGKVFDVISNGGPNMPAYASQIPVEDRWAIVGYVKALQLTRQAPKELAAKVGGDK